MRQIRERFDVAYLAAKLKNLSPRLKRRLGEDAETFAFDVVGKEARGLTRPSGRPRRSRRNLR